MSLIENPKCASTERPRKRQRHDNVIDSGRSRNFNCIGSKTSEELSSAQSEVELDNASSTERSSSPAVVAEGMSEKTEQTISITEICFGTIFEVSCQLAASRGGQISDLLRKIHRAAEPSALELKFTDEYCTVSSLNGLLIGYMNRKTASDLMSWSFLDQLRLEAFMDRSNLDEAIAHYETGTNKVCFTININIFGFEFLGDAVAKQSSQCRLFLQRPDHIPEDIEYRNPQYLEFGSTVTQSDDTDIHETSTLEFSDSFGSEDSTLEDRLWTIMDNLHRPENLNHTTINSDVIATKLMEHQSDVVDFLIKRETESYSVGGTLWQVELADDGSEFFRHVITGSKSPVPNDTVGGILADDMGLGKTLSMIASIATTLEEARCYASSKRASLGNPNLTLTPATLVVVPSALILDGWLDEITKHVVPEKLRCYKYHGLERSLDFAAMSSYDIVLTTYGTVAADQARRRGLLDNIMWYRVILDEAHAIRNWSTKQFQALHCLSAHSRWCVSGTPIQNSLEDLGALVRFLRLPLLEEPTSFRRYIVGGFKVAGQPTRANFDNLKKVLSSICLRRSNKLLKLPGMIYEECRPELTPREREQYNILVNTCNEALEQVLYRQTPSRGRSGVLECLLRLRLYCNQGMRHLYDQANSTGSHDELLALLQQSGDALCAYCRCDILTLNQDVISGLGQRANPSLFSCCLKIVCAECAPSDMTKTLKETAHGHNQCKFCNEVEGKKNVSSQTQKITSAKPGEITPAKLLALVTNIQAKISSEKCLVFSFWRKSIDSIEQIFLKNNIRFARLDGSISRAQRKKALDAFRHDENTRVLLATFGTGSTGLNNLSMASTIHILEPQWNPSVESQAIGRIYRHGQQNQVRVVRYIMKNTIEEGVENRQLRKLELAHSSGLSTENGDARENISGVRKTCIALKEHLSKYMESHDYKQGIIT